MDIPQTKEEHSAQEKRRIRKAFWRRTVILMTVIASVSLYFGNEFWPSILQWMNQGNIPQLWAFVTQDKFTTPALIIVILLILISFLRDKVKKAPTVEINGDSSKRKIVKLDPFSPKVGEIIRLAVFLIFHVTFGYTGWMFLDTNLYEPLGRSGILVGLLETISYIVFAGSILSSFDLHSIDLNHKGEILWFGKPAFSNIPHGFFCYGLPRWFGPELRIVNCKVQLITFGVFDGAKNERKDFVLEGKGYFVILDMAFLVRGADTRIILSLDEDPEKMLVTKMNAVVARFVNMPNETDPSKSRFETIDSLKSATADLSFEILEETPKKVKQSRGNTAQELIGQIGFELVAVDLKDVTNADKTLINAQQQYEARIIKEKEELLNTTNKLDKIKIAYDRTLEYARLVNLPESLRLKIWDDCTKMIERDEKSRTTYEGLGRTFTNVKGSDS